MFFYLDPFLISYRRSGISEKRGDSLLDVIHVIMGRHNQLLPIGHTWKGIKKKAIRRKSRGVFKVKEFTYSLPETFFGQLDSEGSKAMATCHRVWA